MPAWRVCNLRPIWQQNNFTALHTSLDRQKSPSLSDWRSVRLARAHVYAHFDGHRFRNQDG